MSKTIYFTEQSQIEENASSALKLFEDQSNIEQISVFPDIHYCSERSIPVGVAFKTTKVFYPLVTGKDMGCGVAYLRITKKDYLKPFDVSKHYRAFEKESRTMTDEGLGGGNHFLSIEESENYIYLIVHTGSRNLGIYKYQQNLQLIKDYHGYSSDKEWLPIELATYEYIKDYNKVINYASERREQFLWATYNFLVKNHYIRDSINIVVSPVIDSVHNLLEFKGEDGVIHRKGSTQLIEDYPVVIPLSMSRGSLIVHANTWDKEGLKNSLESCSHGAGRLLSRTDTLKHWYSLKKSEKEGYKKRFPELLNRNKEFDSSLIQEFDFAYKDSSSILESQPYLIKVDETKPICTVKFTAV